MQRVRGEEEMEEEEEEDEEDGNQVEKGLSYLAKFGYIDESGVRQGDSTNTYNKTT